MSPMIYTCALWFLGMLGLMLVFVGNIICMVLILLEVLYAM